MKNLNFRIPKKLERDKTHAGLRFLYAQKCAIQRRLNEAFIDFHPIGDAVLVSSPGGKKVWCIVESSDLFFGRIKVINPDSGKSYWRDIEHVICTDDLPQLEDEAGKV